MSRNFKDDYDWGLEIGKGGFAKVYSARKRLTGDLVAIKVIEKSNPRFKMTSSA